MTHFKSCWRYNIADDSSSRKPNKPISKNGRLEDYIRLPFVDDLCLRSAMQDFLRRKPSSKAKLTERQPDRLSVNNVTPEYPLLLLPCCSWKTIYNLRCFHLNAIQGHVNKGMVGLHMCVPEIFGLTAFSWLLRRLLTLLRALRLVCAPPTMKLRRRLVSKTSYAYDL